MNKEIRHQWYYADAPGIIWKYLTEPDLLSLWLMKNDIQPRVGHEFMFNSSPAESIGFDGKVYCQILEIVENEKLVYSWRCGPGKGEITVDSVVTWTLTPKNGGTELTILHSGFTESILPGLYDAMNEGWKMHISKSIVQAIKTKNHEAVN